MIDGFTNLGVSIIELAMDDLRNEPPNSDKYESADLFLKSKWFKTLADECSRDFKDISDEIAMIKKIRAMHWYQNLMKHAKDITDKRIYEISKTWDGSLEDKIIWAWQTAKRPKVKKQNDPVMG